MCLYQNVCCLKLFILKEGLLNVDHRQFIYLKTFFNFTNQCECDVFVTILYFAGAIFSNLVFVNLL